MKLHRLPITARVPLIVMIFIMAVSIFTSERVLSRLIETQTRQIQALADVYLDRLALALVEDRRELIQGAQARGVPILFRVVAELVTLLVLR